MTDNIIELLRPQNIFKSKKRIGPSEDGGYVVAEYICENCSALFSYGVGNDTRFEEDFSVQYGKPSYMFDHTSEGLALRVNEDEMERYTNVLAYLKGIQCYFFPEGLGHKENCKDFIQHYNERDINGYVLLKIDVEGDEYPYFQNTDMLKLSNIVMGIILEIHWIDRFKDQVIKILNEINKYFILYHIHGNNWSDIKKVDNHEMPETFELSFINKRFIDKYEPDYQDYPIADLDIPNNKGKPDYKLTFLKNNISISNDPVIHKPLQMLIGDIVDRYTICKLKFDEGNINTSPEMHELYDTMSKYNEISPYVEKLYEINKQIWDLESNIDIQKSKLLGLKEIGKCTLKIRDLNNLRINIKNEINLKYNEGFDHHIINNPTVISLITTPENLNDESEMGIHKIIKLLCVEYTDNYKININITNVNDEYKIPNWLMEYQLKYPFLEILIDK